MKNITTFVCLLTIFALTGLAQTTAAMPTQGTAKPAKRKSAPKSDADIQTCITERIAKSETLKSESITPIVASRAATLNGTASTAKNKNAVVSLAKRCGATRVTSNLEVQAAATKPVPKP